MIFLGFVKYVSPQKKRIIIDYCRIELEFEFLSRWFSWFSKKILPPGMTKEKREKEKSLELVL